MINRKKNYLNYLVITRCVSVLFAFQQSSSTHAYNAIHVDNVKIKVTEPSSERPEKLAKATDEKHNPKLASDKPVVVVPDQQEKKAVVLTARQAEKRDMMTSELKTFEMEAIMGGPVSSPIPRTFEGACVPAFL